MAYGKKKKGKGGKKGGIKMSGNGGYDATGLTGCAQYDLTGKKADPSAGST